MRTAGGEEAPSSAQVEAAAAAVAVELRFYHLGNNGGIKAMGTLEFCGGSPATLQGNADATTFLDEGTGGTEVCRLTPGLHIGVVEGGEIKDLARLSSFVANPVFATGEEVEVAKGEATDEAKKSVAEGEEDKLGEEAEGEKEEKAEGEERSEEEEEEGEKMLSLKVQVRIWPGTLREFLYDGSTQLTIEEKWALFENIAKCVEYLHLNGVIHRDLKPNNIFIGTDGGIKIGDFGHSCWIKNGEKGSQDLGTLMYTAPELRTGISTEKVDIYSIGVIYLEVFLPINARFNGLYNLMGRSYNPGWVDFGVDMELLMRLTSVHPSDRPSITEILEYINDRH
ncbi:hypothetical protein E2562_016940 [Oryza meyeriana var. granulata]|uniref:Protein kinase domain-containing protein n=1 Tax=Oryza meyeriana var. granulata TaxID=110450 RepID=A0A6G1DXB7_9ORYZ|nr:hypothetical protein E2562_016940 [Oryza meyeriana var. granulata]